MARYSRGRVETRKKRSIAPRILVVVIIVVAAIVVANYAFSSNSVDGPLSGGTSIDESASKGEPDALPTPYMASCKGVKLHSAVASQSLTEILIHNASYTYALPLKTKLTEATNTVVMENGGTGRIASEQPTGDNWMTGEFIRCYRSSSAGPKLSAIDCGGAVGAQVYAPVTGTVVKVKKYKLYDMYDDIQVHIQPEGHPEMDVVLIHLQDVTVSKGDQVFGGESPIAKIRDVYAYIGNQMQLKDYTAKGDNGNHTHIQVNDVNDEDYHGLD